jgi:O-antigen ligase
MLWVFLFWIIFGAWLVIKKQLLLFLTAVKNSNRTILVLVGLFFLSGVMSLFVGSIDRAKLGQFIVLFLQPIPTFFITGYIFKQNPKSKDFLLFTFYFLLGIAGLYAIIQYFTLLGLPPAWWGNSIEPKRALSFFVHPNFYALWSAPLLAFLIPDVALNLKSKILNFKSIAWLIGAIGLLLSLSRSGWLGLAAAIVVYLIVAADKKTRKIIFAGAVIALAIVAYYPNLRYRILLPFYGEKSADSRVELWTDGLRAVKESPILGLGLTGFAKQYGQLNTDPTLDTHNFPHNIFLNFWVETGLLGLITFLWLISLHIYRGLRAVFPPQEMGRGRGEVDLISLSISLFLIALLFQGLVDNPYFKNDLALVFWIILALAA